MRHRKSNRKLGRRSSARKALLRSLVIGLFTAQPTDDHAERIQTTPEKAKEARRLVARLITLGKKGTLAARRRALELLPHKRAVRKLFDEIAPRYADRPGGYTRILRLGTPRLGDAAPQVLFELVGMTEEAAAPRPVVTDQPEPDAPPDPGGAQEPEADGGEQHENPAGD